MALVGGQPHNPNNDYEVPNCAEDTVSDIAFSPVSDFMVATSWDGTVRPPRAVAGARAARPTC